MPSPTRRLFLLRHAEAERPPAMHDHERPLSERGGKDAASMGRYMAQAGLVPQFALVSTSTRTRSTWGLVQKALPGVVPTVFEDRIYESSAGDILALIHTISAEHRNLIVVGHNPGMQRLALYLVGRAGRNTFARLHADYPPGSLAVIEFEADGWNGVAEQDGLLERFATPADQAD